MPLAARSKLLSVHDFAQKLDEVRPSPGVVNMESSLLLEQIALGDEEVLEKLQHALLHSDLGSLVQILEQAGKQDPEHLKLLRKSYNENDMTSVTHAIRRMAGDTEAGSEMDELKPFEGKGFVRRDAEGNLDRLPFLEEKCSADVLHEFGNCWKACRGHNTFLYAPPSIYSNKDEEAGLGYGVMQIKPHGDVEQWDGYGNEALHAYSPIDFNVANAWGDGFAGLATGVDGFVTMDPTQFA